MKTNAAMTRAAGSQEHRCAGRDGGGPRPLGGTRRLWTFLPAALLGSLLALSWCAQAAPKAPNKNVKAEPATKVPAPPVPAPPVPAPPVSMEIPQSLFVIPAGPREGRNPFFPRSTAVQPMPKPKEVLVETKAIVLNGITSKPFPSVMINGVTFEKGEEHEIKLSTGSKLKVRCQDIREDSALIVVNGVQQRELRLRSGL